MRLAALLVVLLSGVASAQSVCAPIASPRLPTVRVGGNSMMQNACVGGGTGPITTLDTNLPGGLTGGWLFKNTSVIGDSAAAISTSYFDVTANNTRGESVACNGERCAHLIIEGGVNSLRTGSTPAAVLAIMVAIVDDALSKGVAVVWLDVTPYAGFAGAGTNPLGQATTYNTLWQAACDSRASNPLLKCLASYSTFVDPSNPGFLLPAYSCDGIHLTQTAMDLYSTRIRTALLSIP